MRRARTTIQVAILIISVFRNGADTAPHHDEAITQEVMQLGYRTDCMVEVTETRYDGCGVGS